MFNPKSLHAVKALCHPMLSTLKCTVHRAFRLVSGGKKIHVAMLLNYVPWEVKLI